MAELLFRLVRLLVWLRRHPVGSLGIKVQGPDRAALPAHRDRRALPGKE